MTDEQAKAIFIGVRDRYDNAIMNTENMREMMKFYKIAMDYMIDHICGCAGCKYKGRDEYMMPCVCCKRNKKDFFKEEGID